MPPRRITRGLRSAVGIAALLASTASSATGDAPAGRQIEIFSVAPDGGRQRLTAIDLDALPLRTTSGPDPQYDRPIHMRGLPLAEVLRRVSIPGTADLALLRFDNGLQIPLPFRDAAFMGKLGAFVARATSSAGPSSLVAGRIEDPHRPPTDEDLRPIRFHGNKLVVSDPALAPVLPSVAKDLRPWLYADSLFAIDLVERATWEAQFDVGPTTQAGARVFLGTCRFCHAIRGAGGALGWDFVDPYPIYSEEWLKHLKADAGELNPMPARTMLSIHVRHRAAAGGNRTMPALRGMGSAEITALWDWLQAIAARPAHN